MNQEINSDDMGNDFYKLFFLDHPLSMLIYDCNNFKIIAVNKAALKFYGYSEKEFLDITIQELHTGESLSQFNSVFKKRDKKLPKISSTIHKKKSGENFFVEVTARDIHFNGINARHVIIINVNDRVNFEKELTREETKFKSLVENISEGIVQADNEDKLLFVNNRYCEMMGYKQEELIGKIGYKVLLDKKDQEIIKSKNIERTKGIADKYELTMKKKDGTPVFMEVIGVPVYDNSGHVIGSLGIHSDITERKETEEHLKRLASFPEQNPNVVIEMDSKGNVLYTNSNTKKVFPGIDIQGKEHPVLRDFSEILPAIKNNPNNPLTREIKFSDKYFEQKFFYLPANDLVRIFSYDISEIKNTLQLLKESEEKFRSLVENSLVGVYLIQDGVFKYINPKIAEILGYRVDELLNIMGPQDVTPVKDWETVRENLRKRVEGEVDSLNYEFNCRRKNGELISVEVYGARTSFKNKPAVIGTLLDITSRKLAEEAIIEKEKNYRNLVTSSADAIYVLQDYHLKMVNPAWEKLFGISEREAVSEAFDPIIIIAEESVPFVKDRFKLVAEGKFEPAKYEMKALTRKGEKKVLEVNVTEIIWQGKKAIQGIYRDITERKEIENILRNSEEKYRDLFQYAPVGIYQSTRDGKIITANDELAKILGYSSTQELMTNNIKVLYPDVNTRENLIADFEPSGSTANLEMQWLKKDGNKIWVNLNAHIIKNSKNQGSYFEGFVKDITVRKKAEQDLKETEIKYRQLIESVSAIFWRSDPETFQFKFVSKQAETLLGYPVKQWLDEVDFWINHIHPEDRENAVQLCKTGTKERKLHSFDYRMITANGSTIWLKDIVQVLVSENDSTELIGVMIDMTQQKKIEEELIKAKDKAEEANRLKSSFLSTVSHEIRSPLNAILGFSSILKEIYYQNASDEDKQFFNSMEEAGVRLLETITQVLDISRLEADDFSVNIKPVSVSKAMVSAHSVLELQAKKKGLTIKLDLPREEIIIPTDEYCLGGVLVNLLSNAIKYSYKGEIVLKLVDKKEYLECSVQDQGIGMSDEYKKHLFETFSQEDVGLSRRYEGTGLGLAITKRYLDLLGGSIQVDSKKNIGTTMTFRLPKKYSIN